MWEYKITKSDLWYQIYRISTDETWIVIMERLQRNSYTLNRDYARTFYHREDAESALILAKVKDRWRTPTTSTKKSESEEKREKKSWSEL